jgi:hypothetical protein
MAPSGSAADRRTKQARPAATDIVANPEPRPAQEPARKTKAAPARSGDAARQAERPPMTDEEKDALFRQFLVWQARRPKAATKQ